MSHSNINKSVITIRRGHFTISVFVNPSIYSRAVDAFLEMSTRLFLPYLSSLRIRTRNDFTDLFFNVCSHYMSSSTNSSLFRELASLFGHTSQANTAPKKSTEGPHYKLQRRKKPTEFHSSLPTIHKTLQSKMPFSKTSKFSAMILTHIFSTTTHFIQTRQKPRRILS